MKEDLGRRFARVAKELLSDYATLGAVLDNCVKLIERGERQEADKLIKATFDNAQLGLLAFVFLGDPAEIAERGQSGGLTSEESDLLVDWKNGFAPISRLVRRLALEGQGLRRITSIVHQSKLHLPSGEPVVGIVEYCYDEEASRRSDYAHSILRDAHGFVDAVATTLEELQPAGIQLEATSVDEIREALLDLVQLLRRISQALGIPEDDLFAS